MPTNMVKWYTFMTLDLIGDLAQRAIRWPQGRQAERLGSDIERMKRLFPILVLRMPRLLDIRWGSSPISLRFSDQLSQPEELSSRALASFCIAFQYWPQRLHWPQLGLS